MTSNDSEANDYFQIEVLPRNAYNNY